MHPFSFLLAADSSALHHIDTRAQRGQGPISHAHASPRRAHTWLFELMCPKGTADLDLRCARSPPARHCFAQRHQFEQHLQWFTMCVGKNTPGTETTLRNTV